MEITAAYLSEHLSEVFDLAVEGETIEITWKGSRLRLSVAAQSGSKLANMVKRDILLVPFDAVVDADPEIMVQLEERWDRIYGKQ
jgi:hypothetical protein